MNGLSDQQLLRDYTEGRSEAAFAELVRRHIDFVYSAALRMVRNAHQAEDVTQGVFMALAQSARQLAARPVLSGWLHRTAQNLAANTVRSDVRRRAREHEAAAMSEMSAESDGVWEDIAPELDAALGQLRGDDRDALLLRYFECKSAREMAQTLGTSEEAAQKRVSRAVERLRELLARRSIAVGASGLSAILSAHAVQAAPAGLVITVSTAATLAGTVVQTAIATTNTIAMTTTSKMLITAAVTLAVGAGIYEAGQISRLRREVRALEQRQAPLVDQIQQRERERDEAAAQLRMAQQENQRLRQAESELPKLRAEVARLQTVKETAQSKATPREFSDPFSQSILALAARAGDLNQHLQRMPEKKIPELQFLNEHHWLDAASDADLQSDAGIRKAFSKLRSLAKNRLGPEISSALDAYIAANQGQLPSDPSQLQPFFKTPLDASILQRYEMLHTGNVNDLPKDAWVISEKRPVDRDYDSHLYVGPKGRSGSWGTGLHSTGDPDPTWATR